MKNIFVFIFLIAAQASAQMDASFDKKLVTAFKKLDVTKIPLSDLRKFKEVQTPLQQLIPTLLPSPFTKNGNLKIQIWSRHCAPCLLKLERHWREPNQIWVNIDKGPEDIARSLQWLEDKKILITAYHDFSGNIGTQTVGAYPIPMELEIKNLKVSAVRIGGPAN